MSMGFSRLIHSSTAWRKQLFTLFVAPTVVNYTSMKKNLRTLDTLFKEHLVDIKHQGPFVLHPLFQKFHRSVKQFLCCLIVDVFFSSSKIGERFLFLRLSPPGDRWCDVLVFVPWRSASQAHQHLKSFPMTVNALVLQELDCTFTMHQKLKHIVKTSQTLEAQNSRWLICYWWWW